MSDSVARTQDIREQLARVRLLALDPDHVDQHQATVLDEAFTSLRLWAEKEHDALHETTQELVKEWAEWIDRALPFFANDPKLLGRALRRLRAVCARAESLPDSFNLPENDVEVEPEPLFSGSFRAIHRGRRGTELVAVKTIQIEVTQKLLHVSEACIQGIRKEAATCKALRHQNICPFYGVLGSPKLVRDADGVAREYEIRLVSKWMQHGPLADFLLKHPKENRFKYYNDVAAGLKYLHSLGLVHGDLKNDNILVDGGPALTAVICDFGTSFSQAITGLATTDSAGRGSFPYLAPEIVLDGERPSQRTDVYAFAITLWESYSGDTPYRKETIKRGRNWQQMSILVHKLNLRPRRSDAMHIPDDLWIAIERCWSADPELRLSLDELNQVFDGLSPESGVISPPLRRLGDNETPPFATEPIVPPAGASLETSPPASEIPGSFEKASDVTAAPLSFARFSLSMPTSPSLRRLLDRFKSGNSIAPEDMDIALTDLDAWTVGLAPRYYDKELARDWMNWLAKNGADFPRTDELYGRAIHAVISLSEAILEPPEVFTFRQRHMLFSEKPRTATFPTIVWKCFFLQGETTMSLMEKVLVIPQQNRLLLEHVPGLCRKAFREGILLRMLSAHCPNITSLFGIFHDEGNSIYGPSIGLITHYMLHGDLERFLGIPGNQVHGPRLAKGVAQAVEFIHEVSILHADIKPQNIFVDGDGNARLGDFGNAMFHPASPISAHDFGSPLYRAPEHIRAASPRNAMLVGEGNDMHQEFQKISHTFEMDVWSLGIVLLWCFTGTKPWNKGDVGERRELEVLEYFGRPAFRQDFDDIDVPRMTWKMMELCWKLEPSERITAASIVAGLSA